MPPQTASSTSSTSAAIRELAKMLGHPEGERKRKSKSKSKDEDDDYEDEATSISPEGAYIMKAIENPNNDVVAQYNADELGAIKEQILGDVPMSASARASLLKRLRQYRYVDELSELREGVWTRWIPLDAPASRTPSLSLTTGGCLCEVRITDDGAVLVCKNALGRFFQFKMETSMVFQKLTNQETVLLYAMDALGR